MSFSHVVSPGLRRAKTKSIITRYQKTFLSRGLQQGRRALPLSEPRRTVHVFPERRSNSLNKINALLCHHPAGADADDAVHELVEVNGPAAIRVQSLREGYNLKRSRVILAVCIEITETDLLDGPATTTRVRVPRRAPTAP